MDDADARDVAKHYLDLYGVRDALHQWDRKTFLAGGLAAGLVLVCVFVFAWLDWFATFSLVPRAACALGTAIICGLMAYHVQMISSIASTAAFERALHAEHHARAARA